MNTIHVLVATGLYPPEIGGPATYVRMLEEHLPNHNIELTVVPYAQVRSLPKWQRYFSYAALLLKQAKKANLIYALDPISVGLPAYFVSKMMGKKFMLRLGGDYAWEQGQQRFGVTQTLDEYTADPHRVPFRVKVLAFLQGFVARHAQVVIAPSEYLKGIIATWGVKESSIKVIYNALSALRINEAKDDLRDQLGYEGRVIATAGRLVPWKGFSELIDVFARLQKEIPDLFLVIIGDGPLKGTLKKKVRTLVLDRKVQFTGRLSKEALGKAVKASDLFVLNTFYEGLSHQLLEVMELGVPIVSTNVGGNPELIVHEVSGLLVDPHDTHSLEEAIRRMLEHETLRTRVSQNAKVRMQQFSENVVIAELAELIAHIHQNPRM